MQIQPPKTLKREGIFLESIAQGILQPHFCTLIIGPPHSGKSHLISQLINQDNLYGGKFDQILFIGTSRYHGIQHDESNTLDELDVTVLQKYIEKINKQNPYQDFNLLIVMDDVIAEIKQSKNPFMKKLFFNRRHLINDGQQDKGTISIIITSQKYTIIPTYIRTCFTSYYIFKCNLTQINRILIQYCPSYLSKQLQTIVSNLKKWNFIYYNINSNKFYNNKFENILDRKCNLTVPMRKQCQGSLQQTFSLPSLYQGKSQTQKQEFFKNRLIQQCLNQKPNNQMMQQSNKNGHEEIQQHK